MKKLIVDCGTGTERYIDLTQDEIAELEISRAAAAARQEEEDAARAAEEAARESARAKLAALGLTEAEVAALVK